MSSQLRRLVLAMLTALASGTLVANPVQRETAAAKPYVTAQLRTPTEDDAVIISVIAFDAGTCSALAKLKKGDALSVTGRAKLAKWQGREGERTGLQMVAERILTLYEVRSKRSATKGNGAGASRHAEAGYDEWVQP